MTRTQRITQVLYSGLGGHGNVAFSLVRAARKQNDDRLFSNIFVGIEPVLSAYQDDCDALGTPYDYVRARSGLPLIRWVMFLVSLSRMKPDVILLHSVKLIVPAYLYTKLTRARLIAIEHQVNDLKRKSEWTASRLLMKLADKVIVLTPAYYDGLKQRLNDRFNDSKTTIIPNGIDTDLFSPGDLQAKPTSVIRIGMASRLTDNKRHDELIEAFETLCAIHPEKSWQLSLAGDGETMGTLKAAASQTNVGDKVTFEGFLDQTALRNWFGTLDIYVHASDGETLSTSLLQALAMGLPIVGSDVPGINNLLCQDDKEHGLLAPNGAPDKLAAALYQAAQPDIAAPLSKNARDLAVSVYSQDAMYQRYNAVMEGSQ